MDWVKYEREKRKLAEQGLSPRQYETEIRRILRVMEGGDEKHEQRKKGRDGGA